MFWLSDSTQVYDNEYLEKSKELIVFTEEQKHKLSNYYNLKGDVQYRNLLFYKHWFFHDKVIKQVPEIKLEWFTKYWLPASNAVIKTTLMNTLG